MLGISAACYFTRPGPQGLTLINVEADVAVCRTQKGYPARRAALYTHIITNL